MRRIIRRARIIIIAVLVVILIAYIYMDFNLKPVILSMAEAKARVMGVEAINNAAYEIMREFSPLTYDALITIIQDNDGRVAMLQADTMRMNEIGTRTALLAQRNLDALAATGMRIPLGAATGSKLLAGRGPAITVNLVPMGSVSTEFVSEFTQAGINQTRHRIYLKIKASVRMVIPTASNVSEVSAYVQIAESIIVGQVPNTFADIQPDNVLDLLPGS
ncbi:MAG: sporulation protein YunB [Oscillospiraceae bacterium]|nr:sporulation protein YunB [Oscillospiraceae bacterium]